MARPLLLLMRLVSRTAWIYPTITGNKVWPSKAGIGRCSGRSRQDKTGQEPDAPGFSGTLHSLPRFRQNRNSIQHAVETHPEDAERFLEQAQQDVKNRYHYYKQLSELEWSESTSVSAVKAQIKSETAKETDNG